MFGDLPKIFDRNFIVGYLLPSSAFLAVSLGVIHEWDFLTLIVSAPGVAFAIFSFVLGIMLVGANRSITRLLEGYDQRNPVRILKCLQLAKFRSLRQKLSELDGEYKKYRDEGVAVPPEILDARTHLMTRLAERFPDQEKFVLPSAFGNAMRAFETYPRAMYGLDIIEGWSRLLAVIPKGYRELLDTAKADTDLWVNIWFLSIVTIFDAGQAILRAFLFGAVGVRLVLWIVVAAAFAVGLYGAWMAAKSAVEWGSLFKAAVDVYLPDLYKRLGFPPPENNEVARARWKAFSQAIMFTRPDVMPERTGLRSRFAQEQARRTAGTDATKVQKSDGRHIIAHDSQTNEPKSAEDSGLPSGTGDESAESSRREEKEKNILYFAYGSNMSSVRLLSRVPSGKVRCTGFISGHRLTFDKQSSDGSGKCDAEATGASEDRVYGVVYEIDAAEKPCLDQAEGLGRGYREGTASVMSDGKTVLARTYYATSKDPSLMPFTWYKEYVLAGAREHSLPLAYVDAIAKVQSREDPDRARDAKRRAVLGGSGAPHATDH